MPVGDANAIRYSSPSMRAPGTVSGEGLRRLVGRQVRVEQELALHPRHAAPNRIAAWFAARPFSGMTAPSTFSSSSSRPQSAAALPPSSAPLPRRLGGLASRPPLLATLRRAWPLPPPPRRPRPFLLGFSPLLAPSPASRPSWAPSLPSRPSRACTLLGRLRHFLVTPARAPASAVELLDHLLLERRLLELGRARLLELDRGSPSWPCR